MTRAPEIEIGPAVDGRADLVIAAAFAGEDPGVAGLPGPVADALRRLTARPGWRGAEKQLLQTEAGPDGPVVALYGLGKRAGANGRQVDEWMREALCDASNLRVSRVAVVAPPDSPLAAGGERFGRLVVRGTYKFERYRSAGDEPPAPIEAVRLVLAEEPPAENASVAATVAGAVAFCRDLANTPGNEATPAWMDDRAAELAAEHGLAHGSLGRAELEARGMGGILAVGSGSENEPRLVRLDYDGGGGPRIALVGKGVTFDTGGISIKPATDMDEMKYDKSGACTVLALARAVAELALPVRLAVYVPLAENMLDGRSYRPGDIVRCYSGKTVEILNTDAEGRMILADALALAAEESPDVLLEYSTLTGASVIALGPDAASLYSPDDALAGGLLAAAEAAGERLWRMPLWPEFVERMKGDHADLKNSSSRWGSANTAAAFLSRFVGGLERWAHLDIAGSAYVGREGDEEPGATGYGVALTVAWLRGLLAAGGPGGPGPAPAAGAPAGSAAT